MKWYESTLEQHYTPHHSIVCKDRLWQWNISSSWTVSMNKNLWRIRALLWNLIIAYQSHDNKNDHLNRPREGRVLEAWVSRYHYPQSSNKQLLLWKISGVDKQSLFFVDLSKKLNSLTCRFSQVSCQYV